MSDQTFEPFLVPFDGPAESLRAVIEPALATLGLELVQLFFVRGAHKDSVRLFIDVPHAGPSPDAPHISMADLERASRVLSDVLDVADQQQRIFPHAYDLEVGSPGVDRPLTKKSHFKDAVGARVKAKTRIAVANARSVTGTLVAADDDTISVKLDAQPAEEAPVKVALDEVQSAHVIFVFEAPQKPGHDSKPGKKNQKPGRQHGGRGHEKSAR